MECKGGIIGILRRRGNNDVKDQREGMLMYIVSARNRIRYSIFISFAERCTVTSK